MATQNAPRRWQTRKRIPRKLGRGAGRGGGGSCGRPGRGGRASRTEVTEEGGGGEKKGQSLKAAGDCGGEAAAGGCLYTRERDASAGGAGKCPPSLPHTPTHNKFEERQKDSFPFLRFHWAGA